MRGGNQFSSSAQSHRGQAHSIARILREYEEINSEMHGYWCAYPLDLEEPFEWHFTVRGPAKTEFDGGVYHGRIILPESYPFAPPSVIFLTPNGRFEVGKKVCLSASNYHPELWQPAWGIRTMLGALCAFFSTPSEGAIHSLDWAPEIRKKLAKDSIHWTCPSCKKSNQEIVAEKCSEASSKPPPIPRNLLHDRTSGFSKARAATDSNRSPTNNEEIAQGSTNDKYQSNSSESGAALSGEQILSKRQPPKRNSRSLMIHLFRRPTNRRQMYVAVIDSMLGILLIVITYFLVTFLLAFFTIF
ncbi:ubiquitin-conjugating enzyme subfamily protein [Cardiosporidium cionae]|uniref:Ubiquitin-conjugating enzyme subfamily protein n=1 Tax=Cardiosporidium cionae TaxID=476202 RepID=A0ABQ7JDS2_9APIC|nr:ubiquitin-conjugating enzyme subfamily protein [Cardiosporidium cionae]|eukprot:KAF8822173.1 ubiquitin-conjugating enzyme subfamily protein [Cardiosporidium cionae]